MRWDRYSAHSKLTRASVILTLLGSLILAGRATAQPQEGPPAALPRLFIVVPDGGKTGTTFETVVTGADIENPQSLVFSHPGIKAELVPEAVAAPDVKQPAGGKRNRPPAALTSSKFKVTIPADAPLGIHDVRVVNKYGISNPRAFVVGDLAEVAEKEPNNDVQQAQRVEMNSTITGNIANPTDVDYFVVAGKKGQRIVVSCLASSIDSRLNPNLEMYDAAGTKLGENRNYHGEDALLDVTAAADGDYLVRLSHFTYTQGTAEHFYRLSITTAPWIDAVYPPMIEPGKPAQVTVYGRNLPNGQIDPAAIVDGRKLEKITVTLNAPNDPMALQRLGYTGHISPNASGLDGFEYRIRNASGMSNPYLIGYARAPVVLDNEKNDTPETAQEIPVPCEIAGRIEKLRDLDWYAFNAKKDELYNLEVFSDRLGSPTDMEFVLYNPATKQVIVELDDNAETLEQFKFMTRTSDPPRYQFKAPADGKYMFLVKSQTNSTQASPRHLYRVSITPSRPDFRLVLMPNERINPGACIVRQGGHQYYDVLVWRHDGFNGEINLTVEGLPAGVTCIPHVVGPALKHAALAISATPAAAEWSGEIKIKGTATINGQPVVREARAASITWPVPPQQNIVTISRIDRNVVLGVRDQAPFTLTATPDKTSAQPGDKINVNLQLARLWPDFKTPLLVNSVSPLLPNQPPFLSFGNNNQPINIAPGNDKGTSVLTVANNALPGTYTFVLRGQAQIPYNKDPKAGQKANVNVVQASTPFTITILPKQLANVTAAPPAAMVKVGTQGEVVIKVARMYEFAGEFKVQLVLPPNLKGIMADEVTIPAGKDEAKLIVKTAADATVGNHANLVVKATAMFNNNLPIVQETKISINVVK